MPISKVTTRAILDLECRINCLQVARVGLLEVDLAGYRTTQHQ